MPPLARLPHEMPPLPDAATGPPRPSAAAAPPIAQRMRPQRKANLAALSPAVAASLAKLAGGSARARAEAPREPPAAPDDQVANDVPPLVRKNPDAAE